jgi:hypothetical protein
MVSFLARLFGRGPPPDEEGPSTRAAVLAPSPPSPPSPSLPAPSTIRLRVPNGFMNGVAGCEGGPDAVAFWAALGANAVRTWGVGDLLLSLPSSLPPTSPFLDACAQHGVAVAAGLWLDASSALADPHEADRQVQCAAREAALLAPFPAVRLFVVGNECEASPCRCKEAGMPSHDHVASALSFVERVAAAVAAADDDASHGRRPRPIATVLADIGTDKAQTFMRVCRRNVGVLGVNTYGGAGDLAARLERQGYTGPYFLAEYGAGRGQWEVERAPWGAPLEEPSTRKAVTSAEAFLGAVRPCLPPPAAAANPLPPLALSSLSSSSEAVLPTHRSAALATLLPGTAATTSRSRPTCVGAFAFFGGCKTEVTPTWYSLFVECPSTASTPTPTPTPSTSATIPTSSAPTLRGSAQGLVREPIADRIQVLRALWRGEIPGDLSSIPRLLAAAGCPTCLGIAASLGDGGGEGGDAAAQPAARVPTAYLVAPRGTTVRVEALVPGPLGTGARPPPPPQPPHQSAGEGGGLLLPTTGGGSAYNCDWLVREEVASSGSGARTWLSLREPGLAATLHVPARPGAYRVVVLVRSLRHAGVATANVPLLVVEGEGGEWRRGDSRVCV